MPVQTEHRFPLDLSVLDAAASRVTLADLRGQARAVAAYFMRTWPRDCTGPCSFNTVASCSSTRPASCDTGWRPPRPPAASTAQRCRPRSTGCKAPTILPQRVAKG